MCWAEKCCYCLPLNIGCVCGGIINFLVSLSLTTASIAYYFTDPKMYGKLTAEKSHHYITNLGLHLEVETMNIIMAVVLVICLFWMVFSILLIVGVTRNQPSLVLCFFAFGIILTILCQISGLLMLINSYWWMAFVVFLGSLINIHFLVVLHTSYEHMLKGVEFGRRNQDQDPLADCFDETLA